MLNLTNWEYHTGISNVNQYSPNFKSVPLFTLEKTFNDYIWTPDDDQQQLWCFVRGEEIDEEIYIPKGLINISYIEFVTGVFVRSFVAHVILKKNAHIKNLDFQTLSGVFLLNLETEEMIDIDSTASEFIKINDNEDFIEYECYFGLSPIDEEGKYTDILQCIDEKLSSFRPIFIISDTGRSFQNTDAILKDYDTGEEFANLIGSFIRPVVAPSCTLVSENAYLPLSPEHQLETTIDIFEENTGLGNYRYGGVQYHWTFINGRFYDNNDRSQVYDVINNGVLSKLIDYRGITRNCFKFCETDYTLSSNIDAEETEYYQLSLGQVVLRDVRFLQYTIPIRRRAIDIYRAPLCIVNNSLGVFSRKLAGTYFYNAEYINDIRNISIDLENTNGKRGIFSTPNSFPETEFSTLLNLPISIKNNDNDFYEYVTGQQNSESIEEISSPVDLLVFQRLSQEGVEDILGGAVEGLCWKTVYESAEFSYENNKDSTITCSPSWSENEPITAPVEEAHCLKVGDIYKIISPFPNEVTAENAEELNLKIIFTDLWVYDYNNILVYHKQFKETVDYTVTENGLLFEISDSYNEFDINSGKFYVDYIVAFNIDAHTVSISKTGSGKVLVDSKEIDSECIVAMGSNVNIKLIADEGNTISKVTIDGLQVDLSDVLLTESIGVYTFSQIDGDRTLDVVFQQK